MKSFLSAISLLTIIPVPYRWAKNISGASLYFSIAGLLIGLIYYGLSRLIAVYEIPSNWGAFLVVLFQIILTRGFHIDGLADMADGFWGGRDKETRLRIMKDSSIGVFGTIAVIMLLLGKWIAVGNLLDKNYLFVLVISAIVSRVSMTVLSGVFSYSRTEGTGSLVISNTGIKEILISIVYTSLLLFYLSGTASLLVLFGGITFSLLVGYLSYVKIGGITGDVLGAVCELNDLISMITTIYLFGKFPLLFHPLPYIS